METLPLQILLTTASAGLLVKVIVLALSLYNKRSSRFFVLLLSCFLLHNIIEVLAHFYLQQGADIGAWYRALYAIAPINAALVLAFAVRVSALPLKGFARLLVGFTCCLALMVAASDLLISTQLSLEPTEVVQKGRLYPLFQLSNFALLVAVPMVLIIGYRNAADTQSELRCAYMLFALSPIVVLCLAVILLMVLEIHWNAVALLPLASSAFLLILYYSESRQELSDLRRYLPFTRERQTSKLINQTFARYSRDEITYKECLNVIETELVNDKFHKKGGNASATAQSMGLPRSSLYSIFARLNISNKKPN